MPGRSAPPALGHRAATLAHRLRESHAWNGGDFKRKSWSARDLLTDRSGFVFAEMSLQIDTVPH
jgi:hypothetical protein